MKSSTEGTAINVAVFQAFFVVLLLSSVVLYWRVRQLPEKTGASGPLLQGGWMLRPFRGVANLINLVEPATGKKTDEGAPPMN